MGYSFMGVILYLHAHEILPSLLSSQKASSHFLACSSHAKKLYSLQSSNHQVWILYSAGLLHLKHFTFCILYPSFIEFYPEGASSSDAIAI